VNSTGIDYVYVIRRTDKNPPMQGGGGGGAGGAAPMPATRPTNTDVLTPRGEAKPAGGPTHALNLMTRAQDAGRSTPRVIRDWGKHPAVVDVFMQKFVEQMEKTARAVATSR